MGALKELGYVAAVPLVGLTKTVPGFALGAAEAANDMAQDTIGKALSIAPSWVRTPAKHVGGAAFAAVHALGAGALGVGVTAADTFTTWGKGEAEKFVKQMNETPLAKVIDKAYHVTNPSTYYERHEAAYEKLNGKK